MLQNRLSFGVRNWLLVGTTTFAVAFVRTYLQYGRYGWESVEQAGGSLLVHFLVITVLSGIYQVFVPSILPYFIAGYREGEPLSKQDLGTSALLLILFTAVLIFLLAHWPESQASDYYDR